MAILQVRALRSWRVPVVFAGLVTASLAAACAGTGSPAAGGASSVGKRGPRPLADASTGPLAGIREQLGGDFGPFVLVVQFTVLDTPEAAAEFERLAEAAWRGTSGEPGHVIYRFSRDPKNPRQITLYEEWASFEDLQHHFALDHTAELLSGLSAMVQGEVSLSVRRPMHPQPRD
jgi:quinol monooxygenase YgiN